MNEKKTAEEILDKISHTYHPEFNARYVRQEAAITSMHRFVTQETAALREENERLKEALKDERNNVIDEAIELLGKKEDSEQRRCNPSAEYAFKDAIYILESLKLKLTS